VMSAAWALAANSTDEHAATANLVEKRMVTTSGLED
jgi:hypothetical protein